MLITSVVGEDRGDCVADGFTASLAPFNVQLDDCVYNGFSVIGSWPEC